MLLRTIVLGAKRRVQVAPAFHFIPSYGKIGKSSYVASDPKLKIKVLICVFKNTYFLKNVTIKFFWKFIVEKNKALSIKKVQLKYFNGEKKNFNAKILVSRSKIYEFSEEKFLIFPM